jgi:hypothetical protein
MTDVEELNHHRPFTRTQLKASGGDCRILRRRAYVSIFQDAWVHRDGIDEDTRIRAALLIHPAKAFASHFSAARLLGLPVPEHRFEHVTVRCHQDRRFRPEIKPHVTQRAKRLINIRGVMATDPITTFIDMAGWLSLVDLVVLGDAISKKYRIRRSRLLNACRSSGDYYAKAAARAAEYVREGVDSPMETRLRMLIVLAGLPEPVLNVTVRDEDGEVLRRYDLCYPDLKLVIEYEGRQHAEDRKQWERDIERREELDDEGTRILLVTSTGVYQHPQRTLLRIRRQLIERGMADVPEIDDAWREHFA